MNVFCINSTNLTSKSKIKMSITTQTSLLLTASHLFTLSLHLLQTCAAKSCTPSSCGIIPNISSPFRLNTDPSNCGDPRFQLSCENDVAYLYLNSQKFYVKEINYLIARIRVVDASISNETCSFPKYSASAYNFTDGSPYRIFSHHRDPYGGYVAKPINLIRCPNPLKNSNSSLFTDVTDCGFNYSSRAGFDYIRVGNMNVVTIIIGLMGVLVLSFASFGEYWHYSFAYYLFPNGVNLASDLLLSVLLVTSLAIIVCLTAALNILVSIIVGFAGVLVLLFILLQNWSYSFGAGVASKFIYTGVISSMVIFVPRFIICPFVVWFLIYKFRRRHSSMFDAIESYLQSDNKLVPIRYSYSDLKKMTKGFQEKLGEGGYGSVYKGKLRSGHHVAIKLLGKSGANGKDFINEIATIGRIHHVNIVKLVGYCAEGSKRALVYDFMPNGSLEKYLFNGEKMSSLNWDTKFEIAVGAARGIEYLHRGCDVQILHFDIKPHNILLDDNFIPKISDFGLAKFYFVDKNAVTMTAARGTIGYVAPELISRSIGAISYKADVYSFGMLLIEMVGLKRDLMGNNGDSNQYFPNWIYDLFNEGKDIEILEGDENDDDDSTRKVGRKITIVALWCIQMNPDDRPPMNKVLEMLEADVERLRIPKYSSYPNQIVVNVDQSEVTISSSSLPMLPHDHTSSSV